MATCARCGTVFTRDSDRPERHATCQCWKALYDLLDQMKNDQAQALVDACAYVRSGKDGEN